MISDVWCVDVFVLVWLSVRRAGPERRVFSKARQAKEQQETARDNYSDDNAMTSEEKILHPQLRPVIPGCAWSARGLLTEAEARDLQDKAMEHGMRHVENNGEALTTDARLRDCVRASLDVPELAETVFKRIQPFLEPEITVDGTEESRMLGLPYGDVAAVRSQPDHPDMQVPGRRARPFWPAP